MSTDNLSSDSNGSSSTSTVTVSKVQSSGPTVPKKLSKMQILQNRIKEDPIVFCFLGLTVLSLTGGLISLLKNDRKQSQMMMRARVFFQFGAVSSLVGGIYYRAYTGTLTQKSGKPSTDKRVYLTDPMPALQKDTTGVIISSSSSSEKSPKLR